MHKSLGTVAAADGVRFARVRWEINFLLIFETAPFFCKHPVCEMTTATGWVSTYMQFIMIIIKDVA
jgi:hypothetical protein